MSDRVTGETHNGRSPLIFVAGVVLLGVALGVLLFGSSLFGQKETAVFQQVPDFQQAKTAVVPLPSGSGPLVVGSTAVEFVAQDLAGNSVALSDFTGQPIILNFWATWCAPCRLEMPEFQATFAAHQNDGLVILAINLAESPDAVQQFFYDDFDLSFTPLLDSEGLIAQQYGAVNLPTTFFIDTTGTISAIHRGPMLRGQIDGYLAEILPGAS